MKIVFTQDFIKLEVPCVCVDYFSFVYTEAFEVLVLLPDVPRYQLEA